MPAGCGGSAGNYRQRWTGTSSPENGAPAECGDTTQATLTRNRNAITFAPSDGVLVIPGTIAADGSISGALTVAGANKRPFELSLTARLTGDRISGTYATPRCRFRVDLSPAAS